MIATAPPDSPPPAPEGAETHWMTATDGTDLAVYALGPPAGPPVLFVHGFLSDARRNWGVTGILARFAALGRRVVAPDLRAHGQSRALPPAAGWPPDILARDLSEIVASLRLPDGGWDLCGYSLGGRVVARALVAGARPRRAVIAGMGLTGLLEPDGRRAAFEAALRHGSAGPDPRLGRAVAAMLAAGRMAADGPLALLAAQAPTSRADLARIGVPVLALAGEKDEDNGSVEALAAAIPGAVAERVPGDHMTAPAGRGFLDALTRFLAD